MSVKREILFRFGLVYAIFGILGLTIIGKIIYIQFVEGADLRAQAKTITYRDITIEPNRGDICANDGRLLATSVPYFEIRVDLKAAGLTDELFYANIDSLAIRLSQLFRDKSHFSYKSELVNARKFARNKRYYPVGPRLVNYLELKQIKEFPLLRLPPNKGGFIPVQVNQRIKPHSSLASRSIGTTNESGVAVGIEGAYDHILRGKAGVSTMQRGSGNMWLDVNSAIQIEPEDGMNVITTLDVTLQDVAEKALRTQLGEHDAVHGSAILMEVSTGNIKAIANLRRNENGTYSEVFNYAIGEGTEPGSTFKLASLIALLEDGHVSLEDTIDTGNGRIKYYDQVISDSKRGGYGKISVKEVFELSSNVGITMLVTEKYKGKEEKFIDRLYAMNLNQPLGIPLKGEAIPYIKYPTDKLWSGISLPMMSIGYEVILSPLQTLTLYNAVANNGKMVKPKFIHSIRHHGSTERNFKSEIINPSICSKKTLAKVREALEGVVENGTARNLRNESYKIAGKTGTAQIAQGVSGYKSAKGVSHQASFVGYFPADNPKFSCIVVVNSPSRSVFYGNLVAGPIFKEIADKVYATNPDWFPEVSNKPVLAELPESKSGHKPSLIKAFKELNIPIVDESPAQIWSNTIRNEQSVELNEREIVPNLTPNVIGMSLQDAIYLLENSGLKVMVIGRGAVRSQSIQPGVRVKRGQKIKLEMTFS
ncbi:MAG TPA: penicillin-binding protein [Perlabentimonas sp.]|nr:penicillin-binding protein [Tenuifilaceae bacterium]HZJ74424.1 penicillin-binding protein [Perlabentimonas sp.]